MVRLSSLMFSCLLISAIACAAPINVAASVNGGVASQSSTYQGDTANFGPQWAIDGDTNGNWLALGHIQHTANEPGAWLRVDFNQPYLISSFQLFNRTDCCATRANGYYMELMLGGVTVWDFLQTNQGNWTMGGVTMAEPYMYVLADSLRVTLLDSIPENEHYLHLAEVQAWSDTVPEPATYALMAAGLGVLALLRRRQ